MENTWNVWLGENMLDMHSQRTVEYVQSQYISHPVQKGGTPGFISNKFHQNEKKKFCVYI